MVPRPPTKHPLCWWSKIQYATKTPVDIVRQVIAPVRRAGGCFGRRDEQGDKLWGEAGLFGESVRGQAVLLVGTGLGRGHSRNRVKPEPRRARSMRHCGPPMGGFAGDTGARGAWRSLLRATHGDHVGSDQQQLEVPNAKLGTDTRASMRSRCGCANQFCDPGAPK